MDYDSHGVPLSVTPAGAPIASLGYNGEHFDLDLGLIYLRSRWYNPTLGRL
jgi:RHS repeat-associated protein